MTPEEKAQELVEKFSPLVTTWDCYYDCPLNPDLILADAKKCALIAAQEVLSALFQHHEIDYWKEVKTEIEKL